MDNCASARTDTDNLAYVAYIITIVIHVLTACVSCLNVNVAFVVHVHVLVKRRLN